MASHPFQSSSCQENNGRPPLVPPPSTRTTTLNSNIMTTQGLTTRKLDPQHEHILLTPSTNSFISSSSHDRDSPLSPILYGPTYRHIWDKENMDPKTKQFITPRSLHDSPMQPPPPHNPAQLAPRRQRPPFSQKDAFIQEQQQRQPMTILRQRHFNIDSPYYRLPTTASLTPRQWSREPLSDITESFLLNTPPTSTISRNFQSFESRNDLNESNNDDFDGNDSNLQSFEPFGKCMSFLSSNGDVLGDSSILESTSLLLGPHYIHESLSSSCSSSDEASTSTASIFQKKKNDQEPGGTGPRFQRGLR